MAGSLSDDRTERLRHLYLDEKKSIPQIAEIMMTPTSTIRNWLKLCGIKVRSRVEGILLRRDVLGLQAYGRTKMITPEWRANITAGRRKWGEENAVGVSTKPNGYIEYTRGPNKGRLVHVVTMEEMIGRQIRKGEVVHHIDDDKTNNHPDNLSFMTKAAHGRLHKRQHFLSAGGK